MKRQTITIAAVVGIIIAAMIAWMAISQLSTHTPPSWIASIPLRTNSSTVNPPPGGIPPEVRCDWFVICGKYIILKDHTNSSSVIGKIRNITLLEVDYKAGDYIELTEFGLARLSGDREKYSDPGKGGYPGKDGYFNNVCYPRSGKWHAERFPVDNDSKYYIHKVTLNLFAYLCNVNLDLVCTVEISPRQNDRQEKVQLACADSSAWTLCDQAEQCENVKQENKADPLALPQNYPRPPTGCEAAYQEDVRIGRRAPPSPISGERVALEGAVVKARQLGFELKVPTSVPSKLKLTEIRVFGNEIGLIYSELPLPQMSSIYDAYDSGALLIFEQKKFDGFFKSFPKENSNRITLLTINGNQAYYACGSRENSLQWVDSDTHVQVIAGLEWFKMMDLIRVGEFMR